MIRIANANGRMPRRSLIAKADRLESPGRCFASVTPPRRMAEAIAAGAHVRRQSRIVTNAFHPGSNFVIEKFSWVQDILRI
jgi:hypothetical protein